MPDQDDQSGILAIPANRVLGDEAANRELVDVRRDAGLFDPLRQMIHPARKNRTHCAAEQIGAHMRRGGRLGSDRRRCCSPARCCDRICRRQIEAKKQQAGGKHCPDHDRCNLRWLDHALLLVPWFASARMILEPFPLRLNRNRSLPPPSRTPATHLARDAGWPSNGRKLRHAWAGADLEAELEPAAVIAPAPRPNAAWPDLVPAASASQTSRARG